MEDPWTPHFKIMESWTLVVGRHRHVAPFASDACNTKMKFYEKKSHSGQVWHVCIVFTWMITWLCVVSLFFPYLPQTSPWSGIVNPNSIRDPTATSHESTTWELQAYGLLLLLCSWPRLVSPEYLRDVVLGCGQLIDWYLASRSSTLLIIRSKRLFPWQ